MHRYTQTHNKHQRWKDRVLNLDSVCILIAFFFEGPCEMYNILLIARLNYLTFCSDARGDFFWKLRRQVSALALGQSAGLYGNGRGAELRTMKRGRGGLTPSFGVGVLSKKKKKESDPLPPILRLLFGPSHLAP